LERGDENPKEEEKKTRRRGKGNPFRWKEEKGEIGGFVLGNRGEQTSTGIKHERGLGKRPKRGRGFYSTGGGETIPTSKNLLRK